MECNKIAHTAAPLSTGGAEEKESEGEKERERTRKNRKEREREGEKEKEKAKGKRKRKRKGKGRSRREKWGEGVGDERRRVSVGTTNGRPNERATAVFDRLLPATLEYLVQSSLYQSGG